MWNKSYDDDAVLYLVPTPIGNLSDITIRAIEILKNVDCVFSEDTRTTKVLFNVYDIKNRLLSLHEFNEDKVKEQVLRLLEENKSVAIVTDRGTPIISDPGFKTAKFLIENGKKVVALPGPCAFVCALIVSGLPPLPFTFYGFLNSKKSQREEELEKLKYKTETLIFYEAPHRIIDTLNSILKIFGDRNISISREISKKYESIYYGNISTLLSNNTEIKGELVLVVEGNCNDKVTVDVNTAILKINHLVELGVKKNDAIKEIASETGISKNQLYDLYHKEV